MHESHSGVNIAAVLTEATLVWCIQPHPPLVSDNASNMTVAGNAFETDLHVVGWLVVLGLTAL